MRRKSLISALFPKTRRSILAATLMHPDRWWFLADLGRHLGVPPSSLQREMESLVQVGILLRREEGKHVYDCGWCVGGRRHRRGLRRQGPAGRNR